MRDDAYDALADVYDWLVPDALLTPQGSVAAFAGVVDALEPGARVLDCAAGTGQLAVGLALAGFGVTASDASGAMVRRTQRLSREHGAHTSVVRCAWEQLDRQGWRGAFDAVFCVGNSLTHAAGQAGRRAALAAMATVMREGGLLVLTSRNWERVRDEGTCLVVVGEELVERRGRRGLVVHSWTIPAGWDKPHHLDVAVALLDPGDHVTTQSARLRFWPFPHPTLLDELRATGLRPIMDTYTAETERYLVTAQRPRSSMGAAAV
jgi:SAM-dependent methyltransferase